MIKGKDAWVGETFAEALGEQTLGRALRAA
jgi:hypothetical protein